MVSTPAAIDGAGSTTLWRTVCQVGHRCGEGTTAGALRGALMASSSTRRCDTCAADAQPTIE
jgi:hypothetical protein